MTFSKGTLYVVMRKTQNADWHQHSICETRKMAEFLVNEFTKSTKESGEENVEYRVDEICVDDESEGLL